MGKGYIHVHRSLMDKGYYKDSHFIHLWIHLLMCASYQDKEYLFKGQIIYLKPGQFITSRDKLSLATGISTQKIERVLLVFEKEGQIEQQKTNKFRIISICNWIKYQVGEQQMNNKRTTSGQPADTINKENKENKNIYVQTFALFWKNYPKKEGKKKAWEKWQNIKDPEAVIEKLRAILPIQMESEQWLKENGQFIPLPATYIFNERWEDEIK